MERYRPGSLSVQSAAALAVASQPAVLADVQPRPSKTVARYRGAKRNAMKTQRPYTPKAERHKVAHTHKSQAETETEKGSLS